MIPLHDDNPTSIHPVITITLIVACSIVFFWQVSLPPGALKQALLAYSMIPTVLLGSSTLPADVAAIAPPVTLITSMFLHGGWMHLIGNMLYLWIFGNNVEDSMGHARFILFYVLCGVVAGLAHAFSNSSSDIPTIGASGAISGVLGAYLLLYPHARILVFVPFGVLSRAVYLPASLVLGMWFVLQIVNSAASSGGSGGGVAWGAHIGGFVAGMVLIFFFKYRQVPLFHPRRDRGWDD